MNHRLLVLSSPLLAALLVLAVAAPTLGQGSAPDGFRSLFNGEDLSGWNVPEGDGGHWRVVDGVIDYDARSEAEGDRSLYTEEEFGDYVLLIDWRLKTVEPYTNPNVPIIRADGTHRRDQDGEVITMSVPDSDSGILPRGHGKGQANIWNWPYGSGEVYGYRMDESQPKAVRAAAVPRVNADRDVGEWNRYRIRVEGETMTVHLNGRLVIDGIHLSEIPDEGPIGLQHHGSRENGEWVSPPSLVQFRNVYVRELD